eukprot:CAMPEP_0177764772 /NCGR_PEP_ID=MMETSP0491_2-20121128/7597_1 /TAXON_ID=63592 /ORGANISM="Tetraselmis chuii, Strain PLY429" /LENGTH=204 /DNA_ID=CAMNT_0019280997 /DNA_START=284 /DNA_END=899 /DNA_ORIENTATION=+
MFRREPIKGTLSSKKQAWKHRLREDCVRRVKEQRETILLQIRQPNLPQEEQAAAVRSALNGIISANSAAGRSSSTTGDASTSDELSQEEYVNLMSVLEAELLMEEDMLARESQQAALAAFEAACGLESYADNLLAQQHSEEQQLLASTGEEAVLCPVCEQAYLIQTAHGRAGGIVACRNQACQLRLDCAAEGLTLDNVGGALRV